MTGKDESRIFYTGVFLPEFLGNIVAKYFIFGTHEQIQLAKCILEQHLEGIELPQEFLRDENLSYGLSAKREVIVALSSF